MKLEKTFSQMSELDQLKFKRGLQVIRKNLFISFTIYFTSFCLGILLQVFIVHLSYFAIRYFSFGAHLKQFWLCVIQSMITFVAIPYLLLRFTPVLPVYSLGLCAALLIIILGPQPTKAQPVHDYMMKSLHIKTIIVVVVLEIIAYFTTGVYSMLINYGIIIQSLTLMTTFLRRRNHV